MEELASILLVKRDARRPWRPYKRKPLFSTTSTETNGIFSTIFPVFNSTINQKNGRSEKLRTTESPLNGVISSMRTYTTKSSTTTRHVDQRQTGFTNNVTSTISSFEKFYKSFRDDSNNDRDNSVAGNRFLGSTEPVQTGSTSWLKPVQTGSGKASTLLVGGPTGSTIPASPLDYSGEGNDLWWSGVLWEDGGAGETAGNLSWNATLDRNITDGDAGEDDGSGEVVAMVVTAFLLGLIILATVIGNVFVIAAILLERHLQSVANYLILSLAVADLLVACLVMPLGAVYQVSQEWTLGPELCDMWTSSDVLCCTASILHLVAIALDRYWAVTNIDYIHQRTGKRIGLMILVIWSVSFLVCIAPLLGWKDPGWEYRVSQERMCLVSQDIGYQIFATLASFYLPLLVILFLYWRIFQTARKRIRRRVTVALPPPNGQNAKGVQPPPGGVIAGLCAAGAAGGSGGIAAAVVGVIGRPLPTISEATTTTTTTTAFTNVSSANTSPEKGSFGNGLEPDLPTCDPISSIGGGGGGGGLGGEGVGGRIAAYHPPKRKTKESAETKRERKAAKTLAIITGAFVVCWLPFFIMAVLLPGDSGLFHQYVIAFFLWLGYFNSTLNPVIYTVFSPEFRHAFKRLLCGRRTSVRRRHAQHFVR